MKNVTKAAAIIISVGLAACRAASPEVAAKKAADEYLDQRSLRFDNRKVEILDGGANWIINYRALEGYTGGDIKVYVEKDNMNINGFVAEQ